jgi:tetratricopeptide (TPR) repeat protein
MKAMPVYGLCATLFLFVVGGYSVIAQTTNLSPASSLPPHIARALKQSEYDHTEALHKRFDPVIQDLNKGYDSDYAELYSAAIYAVFFANQDDHNESWRQWKEDNKSVLRDPRLPLATETSAIYLQGQLYLLVGQKDEAFACFKKVLNTVANGPSDLTGFHLMQEELQNMLLFKYYQIPKEYLSSGSGFQGSINKVEPLFKALILPTVVQTDPQDAESFWNTAIVAIGNASSLSDSTKEKYAIDDYPRLVLEEAECLEQLGQKKEAINILETLIARYPDSPKFQEMTDALIKASNSK